MIYYIQNTGTGHIKIGTAIDPALRLGQLQTGASARLILLAVAPGGRTEEGKLHARFAKTRVHGEWFSPTAELLQLVSKQPSPGSTAAALKIPCMKCGKDIGQKGAFYLPEKERIRTIESLKRKKEFEARFDNGLVVWALSEMKESGELESRWQIHCLGCMKPCYDHPDDEGDLGCGGHYWFDRYRAATWPAVAEWTAHMFTKSWFHETNWDDVLRYLVAANTANGQPADPTSVA